MIGLPQKEPGTTTGQKEPPQRPSSGVQPRTWRQQSSSLRPLDYSSNHSHRTQGRRRIHWPLNVTECYQIFSQNVLSNENSFIKCHQKVLYQQTYGTFVIIILSLNLTFNSTFKNSIYEFNLYLYHFSKWSSFANFSFLLYNYFNFSLKIVPELLVVGGHGRDTVGGHGRDTVAIFKQALVFLWYTGHMPFKGG